MVLLTVFSLPIFIIYKSGHTIQGISNLFKVFNAGNLSASTTLCTNIILQNNQFNHEIQCPYNTVIDYPHIIFGMYSKESTS